MNDGPKRRHIRDIAHLYISGARQREPAPRLCLLMAGENGLCLPGFHAANLAAALAARGCDVRLHERSGLLPNAGFYLSLPPTRYIPWVIPEGEPAVGLSGVTVDFTPRPPEGGRGGSSRTKVDLFHLPPLSRAKFVDSYSALGEYTALRGGEQSPPVIAVIVRGGGPQTSAAAEFFGHSAPGAIVTLRTHEGGSLVCEGGGGPRETRTDEGADDDAGGEKDPGEESPVDADRPLPEIGRVAAWETALADRVPVVVRAPDSELAAAYLAAADALRFKTDELRRTTGEPAAAEGSDGLRSGSADRGSGGEGTVLPISRFGTRHSR